MRILSPNTVAYLIFILTMMTRDGDAGQIIVVAAPKLFVQESEVGLVFSTDLEGIRHSVNKLVDNAEAINKTDTLNVLEKDATLFHKDGLTGMLNNEVDKATRTKNRIETFFSVLSTPARNKREIKLIGQIWKLIAGSPDAGDAKRWEENFHKIKQGLQTQAELNENSAKERNILHSVLNSHTETLHNLTKASMELLKKTAKSEDEISSTFFLLSYLASLENWRDKIESTMYKVEIAYAEGRTGFLSPYVINSTELAAKILTIETHERHFKPLFGSIEAHKYFEYPLTSSYLTKSAMHTHIRVPLLDFNQKVEIFEITRQQKEDAIYDIFSYSYVAKQDRGQGYHYLLEQNDLDACLRVDDSFVCRRRRARIFGNEKLGDSIVRGLDDNTFLIKISEQVNATLSCTGRDERVVEIGLSAAYVIPKDCELRSRKFEIPKVINYEKEQKVSTFTEIEHPALTLLDKPKSKSLNVFLNETEYELNRARVEEMSNLTQQYRHENDQLQDTIDNFQIKLVAGMAVGVSVSVILLTISIIAICCLCKLGKKVNGTKRISCCM